MIESPVINDSVTNKQPTQKESIYHTCRSVFNALTYVKGFDTFMDQEDGTDPLTKLWHICRQGSSLCYLYNTLKPDTPIKIKNSSAANKSKAYVYHFVIACRDQLHFPEDTLFTVTELFQNDTNKLVKVVNTVKRILDLLEKEGIIKVQSLSDESSIDTPPKDMRDNVVFELISTERKYVQDLESLQNYMKEVSAHEILSQDTMHYLFGNLNALVDFQRRFLIQMEEQLGHPPKQQRFGLLFTQFEDAFSVYEPFCANFQIAQDLVIQEAPKLQRLNHIMSPTYELPAMLIKPIQRVCKYPLLLQQLLKSMPDQDWPYRDETQAGLEAIQRITKKVNETKRLQENLVLVADIRKRLVGDNTSLDTAGPLLLHDRFSLQKHETDQVREMTVFLFEKLVLVCKEIKDVNKNAISIKKKRKEGSLVVRGKILISRVEHVKGSSVQNGNFTLHLSWMENNDMQTILLKCRNDEHLRQWLDVIIDLKKSTTKLDVFPSSRVDFQYDEDEEDYYYDLSEEEEEESNQNNPGPLFSRNRSYSIQYPRPPDLMSRKASVSNTLSSSTRHFMNGIPGMTLPPLPRSPTTNVTPLNTSGVHHEPSLYSPSNLSFPSSPPISYPSSPTNHRTSALWQRRQSHKPTPSHEHVIIEKYEDGGDPYNHVRVRSQSSPNIQRPPANDLPTLPPLNLFYEKRKSINDREHTTETTKLKVHYMGTIYIVIVPSDIGFEELVQRIESKVRSCGQDFHCVGLKYEDEDGDLITISSSEDVQMGFESKGANNSVNLYVTS